MNVSRSCCALLVGAALFVCACWARADVPEREAVLACIMAHYEKISGMEVRSVSTGISPAGEETSIIKSLDRMEFGLRAGLDPMEFGSVTGGPISRFYTEMERRADFGEMDMVTKEVSMVRKTKKDILTFDGKNSFSFNAWVRDDSSMHGTAGKIVPDAHGIFPFGGTWVEAVMPISSYPLEWLLDNADVSGPTEWKGRQVYVIDCCYGRQAKERRERNFTFYVDPERDFAKCYSEQRRRGGKVVETVEVTGFVEQDGLWLPSSYEVRGRFDDEGKSWLTKATLEYVRINPSFEPKDFHIQWPAGTAVFDDVAGVQYYAMGVSPTDPLPAVEAARLDALLEEVDEVERKAPAQPEAAETSADGAVAVPARPGVKAPRRGVLVIVFGICLLLGVATVTLPALIRRRRQGVS